MTIDPIKRELLKNALTTIADNVMLQVVRTARSTVVKNNLDFSACIFDSEGQVIAQGLAVPVHLGAMMPALRGCLDYFREDIREGDILASNDPYAGGSHLNDIFMFKPVFVGDERVAFIGLILHHTDMGGRVPGGNAGDSSEIWEEGLRIPPTKIYAAGQINTTLLRIIEHNVRVPERNLGDLRAQVAALDLAEKDLLKLLADHPIAEFRAYVTDLLDYTERLTRAAIRELPDGEYEFTDWNDDDGIGGPPIRIHVKITVRGDEITVDFTGTSDDRGGAVHTNYWFTAACAYAALRSVFDPAMPNNAGFYRAIRIVAPERTFVNPVFPAALGARGQGGHRVRAVVLGAMAQMLPHRVPACPGGSEFSIVFAGREGDKRFLMLEFHNSTGQGGGPDLDGQDGGPYCLGNMANTPVELLEAEYPLLIEEYAFLPDSGGPGRCRGALGLVRQYRMLADDVTMQLRSDRALHQPWGLFGGGGGRSARSILNPGRADEQALPSKLLRKIRKGDVFRGEMAAAGGWGPPFERDPALVAEDVRQEKMTIAHARDVYGVVIDERTGDIDEAATVARRWQGPRD